MGEATLLKVLLVSSGESLCALSLADVRETMRPLPIEGVQAAPEFVLGLSLIRGASLPVVDLALLLGNPRRAEPRRFVTLAVGERRVALAVADVLGIRELSPERFTGLPPLIAGAREQFVEALSNLDARLLVVLRAARTLPESVFSLERREANG